MLFLGIDMGTSYFKAGIFDRDGTLHGLGRARVSKQQNGAVNELSVADFWNTLNTCINAALQEAGKKREDILHLSYASQANTFILLDRNGKELTPFIIWNDERAQPDPELEAFSTGEEWRSVTGMGPGITQHACICKLRWFAVHQPVTWQQTAYVLTLPDYLSYILTGGKHIDTSTASLLGLLEVEKTKWWSEALAVAGLTGNMLAAPCTIGSVLGRMQTDASKKNKFAPSAVLYAGGLDHHIAALGAGIGTYADISESTGTVIAAVCCKNDRKSSPGVYVAAGLNKGTYFHMAFDLNGAVALEAYQKKWAQQYSIEALQELAAAVPDGCEGLTAKPRSDSYDQLEGFTNIRPIHHPGHFARAIMESTAYSLKNLVEEISGHTEGLTIASTCGGGRSRVWADIKSRILGCRFVIPRYQEAACCGAAMIAAAGSGSFANLGQVQKSWLANKHAE